MQSDLLGLPWKEIQSFLTVSIGRSMQILDRKSLKPLSWRLSSILLDYGAKGYDKDNFDVLKVKRMGTLIGDTK
jgi:hypothetical protein